MAVPCLSLQLDSLGGRAASILMKRDAVCCVPQSYVFELTKGF